MGSMEYNTQLPLTSPGPGFYHIKWYLVYSFCADPCTVELNS